MTILRVLVYRENIDDWICRSSINTEVRRQGDIAPSSGGKVSYHIDFDAVQFDIFTGLQWSVLEVTTAYVIYACPRLAFYLYSSSRSSESSQSYKELVLTSNGCRGQRRGRRKAKAASVSREPVTPVRLIWWLGKRVGLRWETSM